MRYLISSEQVCVSVPKNVSTVVKMKHLYCYDLLWCCHVGPQHDETEDETVTRLSKRVVTKLEDIMTNLHTNLTDKIRLLFFLSLWETWFCLFPVIIETVCVLGDNILVVTTPLRCIIIIIHSTLSLKISDIESKTKKNWESCGSADMTSSGKLPWPTQLYKVFIEHFKNNHSKLHQAKSPIEICV